MENFKWFMRELTNSFLHSVMLMFSFFERASPPMVSLKGEKILEDKEDREKVFKAIALGTRKVETKQGTVYIN